MISSWVYVFGSQEQERKSDSVESLVVVVVTVAVVVAVNVVAKTMKKGNYLIDSFKCNEA
jgi:uncharacterized Rmd1/YagE family protein